MLLTALLKSTASGRPLGFSTRYPHPTQAVSAGSSEHLRGELAPQVYLWRVAQLLSAVHSRGCDSHRLQWQSLPAAHEHPLSAFSPQTMRPVPNVAGRGPAPASQSTQNTEEDLAGPYGKRKEDRLAPEPVAPLMWPKSCGQRTARKSPGPVKPRRKEESWPVG